jgi:hypothetical protein
MKKLVFTVAVGALGLMFKTTAVHAQLDHMLCYKMTDSFNFGTPPPTVDMLAQLQPEFTQNGCTLVKPVEFCVPADKTVTSGANPNPNIVGAPLQNDYTCYSVQCPKQVEPASKVATDQFGTHVQKNYRPSTVCVPAVKDPVECGGVGTSATGAAMCNGACPTGDTCQFDRKNKICTCTGQTACTGKPNSAGLCGGPCPAGQVCAPEIVTTTSGTTTKECACQNPPPPLCGMDQTTGTCGGTCPPAEKCSLDAAGQCSCQSPTACGLDATTGVCSGICQLPGQQCHPDATGACTCVTPCGQNPLTGQCGGECTTSTDVCALTSDGCACVPPTNLPCSTVNGTCGGVCPAGETCGTDSTGACNCKPASPCGLNAANQCGGVCPAGTTCTLIQTTSGGPSCGCLNSPAS